MSYSGGRPNELLVFLKPFSIPPYKTVACAKWLVKKRHFRTINDALNYITFLETNRPMQFKYLMSEYYRITDYQGRYLVFNEHVNNITTPQISYGEEIHMYY